MTNGDSKKSTTTEKTKFSERDFWFAIAASMAVCVATAGCMWFFMTRPELKTLETAKISAFMGAILIFSGIATALAGFVYGLGFPVEKKTETEGIQQSSWGDIVKVLPELLTKAAGVGIALVLLGVALLAADSIGRDDDAAADASPTPASGTPGAAEPGAGDGTPAADPTVCPTPGQPTC